ncbi:antitoxin Xre/MbcA/ParS toxin-binding domain-containing protein [Defluviimonas salinarum]|uniref:DUF2384 domain-containing protein n=1 Tax=Defluviimonas salinarum TaxID=2992147 RepID=A0ABT3J7F5_9RHOB|nr:antitoxin Xre/MbcA/ParS toxin-binding domain-containing protein [Defluviimonas salinarum]MCW3783599.1 DUF2384 domain-containing protein [Defluviimonas salinarum]
MLAYASVPGLLGLKNKGEAASPLKLMARIEDGLPVGALAEIAETVTPNAGYVISRIVAKATLSRRKKEGALSPAEGAVVARLAAIWSQALEVWGDAEDARAFLNRPHPMLDGRSPLDVTLQSEIGGEVVSQILGRLQYGSAA